MYFSAGICYIGGMKLQKRIKRRRIGKIVASKAAIPSAKERYVAEKLIQTGYNVIFIPVRTTKTPDIIYRGMEWEIKTPCGKSSRTIENCVRMALRQAENIVIDLSEIQRSEEQAWKDAVKQFQIQPMLRRMIVVMKDGEMREMP